jgi:transcriptional regulator with XRE-family HTH domain
VARISTYNKRSKEIAAILKSSREEAGLSMTEVANRAGLSQQMVSYIEREIRQLSVESLLRICDALEISASSVLEIAEDKVRRK